MNNLLHAVAMATNKEFSAWYTDILIDSEIKNVILLQNVIYENLNCDVILISAKGCVISERFYSIFIVFTALKFYSFRVLLFL